MKLATLFHISNKWPNFQGYLTCCRNLPNAAASSVYLTNKRLSWLCLLELRFRRLLWEIYFNKWRAATILFIYLFIWSYLLGKQVFSISNWELSSWGTLRKLLVKVSAVPPSLTDPQHGSLWKSVVSHAFIQYLMTIFLFCGFCLLSMQVIPLILISGSSVFSVFSNWDFVSKGPLSWRRAVLDKPSQAIASSVAVQHGAMSRLIETVFKGLIGPVRERH